MAAQQEAQDRSLLRQRAHVQRGFELIEIVITIGLVSTLFIIFLSVSNVVQLQANAYRKTLARQLIIEESEALRNASFAAALGNRTSAFIEVAYNVGAWQVQTAVAAQSGSRVYRVTNASGALDPSRQVVPAGRLGNGTYETYFRVPSSAPADWAGGFAFRYRDDQNHYLLSASATTLTLSKVVQSVPATLATTSQAFARDTWYRMTVTATGGLFTVQVNGVTLLTATDVIFAAGQFVLIAQSGAAIEYDDVSYTKSGDVSATRFWDFDGSNETVGAHAYGWKRIGPTDLPSGETSITITDAQTGFSDLKQVVLTVSWIEQNGDGELQRYQSVANTFFISQESVAP